MSQDWSIAYEDSNGNWVATTSWNRPNQDLETGITSTIQKVKMSDGSDGFVIPETESVVEPMTLVWFNTEADFRTNLTSYITDGTKIKITTHTSEVFTGYVTSYRRVWFVGRDGDEYDIMVTIDRIS